MSIRAHIAIKYDVQFAECECYTADEFSDMINQLRELDDAVVIWDDERGSEYELSRSSIQGLVDSDMPGGKLKEFSSWLLSVGEQDQEVIVVKFY